MSMFLFFRLIWWFAGKWRPRPRSVQSQPARPRPGKNGCKLATSCTRWLKHDTVTLWILLWQHIWAATFIIPDLCLVFVWVQLKSDMAAGFGEALQRKLLEVEGLYSQVRSRYTFIQALVRRIRGLLRQPKSWGTQTHKNKDWPRLKHSENLCQATPDG